MLPDIIRQSNCEVRLGLGLTQTKVPQIIPSNKVTVYVLVTLLNGLLIQLRPITLKVCESIKSTAILL